LGEVWRATDTKLGRDVALKILPTSVASDPARMARFEREAKALASLKFPTTVVMMGPIHGTVSAARGSPAQLSGLDGLIDSLLYAQHNLEIFRRSQPDCTVRHSLDCIANRLCKILSQTRKLANEE
jgi:serine/threonine protein kinase